MSPAISRLRLLLALLCVMMLSTSCGTLTTVRGDDNYYSRQNDNKNKKKDKKKSSGKKKKDNKKKDNKKKSDNIGKHKDTGSKSGKGNGGGSSVPFRIPSDLDDSTLALIQEALSWIGTPYEYGGETKKGADCSGFVMMTYKNALGINLPRTSADQGKFCEKVDKSKLEVGDLIFFHAAKSDRINHVGIYVGEGKFIHASSSKGVMISDLDLKYFVDRYHHGGKVTQLRRMRGKK